MNEPLITANHVSKYFEQKSFLGGKSVLKAVDEVDITIHRGETLGLVGESGCGKSTLSRTLVRILEPSGGTISYGGADITSLKGNDLAPYHSKMQIIYQDPYSALNPNWTVEAIVAEPLAPLRLSKEAKRERVLSLLADVGLREDAIHRRPGAFSGGQRQRIGIARALSTNPEFIVCDEPISALDVSIQAQVINLLMDLKAKRALSYLFVAHDLAMVRHIADRVAVMYLGKIVEEAPTEVLFNHPLHPYTRSLFSVIPIPDPILAREVKRVPLQGELPDPMHIPSGCRFRTRCPYATTMCEAEAPTMVDVGGAHKVACHLHK
ncbi:ABC transporter ATP-binding protein [Peptoniphilus equinus]|uniref:ABC transporter ATP-binding protein n=1 Tax=Peptoniphilus equinus TaxID=3016343 RepID=A0ABY7QTZ4_9FIRM|nr:ABC transporter ATP-binding protein [Peptoniphilus equinus]WBW49931.1 ABC transporter ATP-binding protein [Peptoniphilus equinus]